MGVLTQLDVINEMLGSLAESPINALDEDHPLVAAGLRILRIVNVREQAKQWWFNKELTLMTPDVDGSIYIPDDIIRLDPSDGTLNYVQRGRRLFKAFGTPDADSFKFDQPIQCWVVRLIPFDDLPPSAQLAVSYSAQVDFMRAYDADAQKLRLALQFRSEALTALNAEHIRNVNANMLNRPGVASVLASLTPQISSTSARANYGMIRG